jgi:hypothetical protein
LSPTAFGGIMKPGLDDVTERHGDLAACATNIRGDE